VVDTKALICALAEQKLSAAGLDVLVIRKEASCYARFYEERQDLSNLLANHVLVHMRNVVNTPHSGFNTQYSRGRKANTAVKRILDVTIENIRQFAKGQPTNVVV